MSDRKLSDWLAGTTPPKWSSRPQAKDDVGERARELRLEGKAYSQIAAELGVVKSTLSLWLRDLPYPDWANRDRDERCAAARRGCEAARAHRDSRRHLTVAAAAASIESLSARELFVVGVALYWAEGTKDKPYRRSENVTFSTATRA